jgi:hypothetical protein
MFARLRYLLGWILSVFRCREDLVLENVALRQQLQALHAKRPRPRLSVLDKLFWVALHRAWSGWKRSLILVSPETVVRWYRAGFRLYWGWISRARKAVGRKPISREVRELIFRMVAENPTWGAPRIHGELLKLGFGISERTVSLWVKRATRNPDPARRWPAFLRNHREAIAAMDFFTVPTASTRIDRPPLAITAFQRAPAHGVLSSGEPQLIGREEKLDWASRDYPPRQRQEDLFQKAQA